MQQLLSLMSKADVALSRFGVQQLLSLMSKAVAKSLFTIFFQPSCSLYSTTNRNDSC